MKPHELQCSKMIFLIKTHFDTPMRSPGVQQTPLVAVVTNKTPVNDRQMTQPGSFSTLNVSGAATFAGVTFGNALTGNLLTVGGTLEVNCPANFTNGLITFGTGASIASIPTRSVVLTDPSGNGTLTYTDASGLLVNGDPVGGGGSGGITEIKSSNGSGISVETTQGGHVSLSSDLVAGPGIIFASSDSNTNKTISSNLVAGVGISIVDGSGDTSKLITSNLTAGQGIAVDFSGLDMTIRSNLEAGPGISLDVSGAAWRISANGSGSASGWSTFKAIQAVDLSGNSIVSSGDIAIDASGGIAMDASGASMSLGTDGLGSVVLDASGSITIMGTAPIGEQAITLDAGGGGMTVENCNSALVQVTPSSFLYVTSVEATLESNTINITSGSGAVTIDASGNSATVQSTSSSFLYVTSVEATLKSNTINITSGSGDVTIDASGGDVDISGNSVSLSASTSASIQSANIGINSSSDLNIDASANLFINSEIGTVGVTGAGVSIRVLESEIEKCKIAMDASGGFLAGGDTYTQIQAPDYTPGTGTFDPSGNNAPVARGPTTNYAVNLASRAATSTGTQQVAWQINDFVTDVVGGVGYTSNTWWPIKIGGIDYLIPLVPASAVTLF